MKQQKIEIIEKVNARMFEVMHGSVEIRYEDVYGKI